MFSFLIRDGRWEKIFPCESFVSPFFAVLFNVGSHHKYLSLSSTNEKLDRSNFIEGVRALPSSSLTLLFLFHRLDETPRNLPVRASRGLPKLMNRIITHRFYISHFGHSQIVFRVAKLVKTKLSAEIPRFPNT